MPRLDGRFEQAKKELESDPNIPPAVAQNPGEALIGAQKGLVNFGPEGFNAATNLAKTSLNGFSLLAETSVARSGYFSGFRQTDAFNLTPLLHNENQAQAGGSLLFNLGAGKVLAEYGNYNLGLESSLGTVGSTRLPITLTAPGALRPNYMSATEFGELPKTGTIDPRTIRYSQESAGATFKPPYGSVDDFSQGLANRSIDPASIAPIRIVERDGKIFTLDNRRLSAFEQARIDCI